MQLTDFAREVPEEGALFAPILSRGLVWQWLSPLIPVNK
jgi:hypothetical protein